jgi:hypothetical protein
MLCLDGFRQAELENRDLLATLSMFATSAYVRNSDEIAVLDILDLKQIGSHLPWDEGSVISSL